MNLSPFPLHFFILSPFSCSQASRLLQFLQPWLNISFHTFNSHVEIRVCYIKRESVTCCLPVSVGTLFAAWCIIGGGRANKIVVWRVQPHEDWGRTLLQSSYLSSKPLPNFVNLHQKRPTKFVLSNFLSFSISHSLPSTWPGE